MLLHGGLYEPMDSERFWVRSGAIEALAEVGIEIRAPDRPPEPRSWAEEADAIARYLADVGAELVGDGGGPVAVLGGSNGCSTAIRLAIDHPGLVDRLALCWPVTPGSERVGDRSLAARIGAVSGRRAAADLLAGRTLRGVLDRELTALPLEVAVMASEPENPVHRHRTADRLLDLLAHPVALTPSPEPVTAGFEPARFAATVDRWLPAGDRG